MSATSQASLPARRRLNWPGLAQAAYLSRWLLPALLLARLGLQAALLRAGFQALTADDFGRVVQAANWAAHWTDLSRLDPGGVWLPLYTLLHGLALKLYPDLALTPRLVTLLFGLLSLPLMAALTRELTGSRAAALLSAFLLAVNPAHLWLGAAPLSEMPYFTLLLAALLGLARYWRDQRASPLLAAAACLALANGLRFEGWVVSLLFGLLLLGRLARPGGEARPGLLLAAALLPWAIPALWAAAAWLQDGSPLAFLETIRGYKQARFPTPPSFLPYLQSLAQLEAPGALLALPGLWLLWKRPAARWYLLFALLPPAAFVALHAGQYEPPANLARYLAPFLFLLLPPASAALLAGLERFVRDGRQRAAALSLILCALALLQARTAFTRPNDPAAAGLEVGRRLKALRQERPDLSARPALLELHNWEFLAVQVGANEIGSLLYDRPSYPPGAGPSALAAPAEEVQRLLQACQVGLLILRAPELRASAEGALGLQPLAQVNGYAFYPVPGRSDTASGACPLQTGADW